MKLVFTFPLIACIVGCAHWSETRTGNRHPALPKGCPVEFVESTNNFDAADHEMLGMISTSAGDGYTESIKAELAPRVCAMGGTTVTIMASSSGSGYANATFNVHRRRDQPGSTEAIACSGTYHYAAGGSIEFDGSDSVLMRLGDRKQLCSTKHSSGHKISLSCETGNQTGSFSPDCAYLDLGGVRFIKMPD